MMSDEDLDITIIADDQVTAAHLTLHLIGARTLTATGTAKRHPNDRDDPTTGRALALSRALRSLADQAETIAVDRIAGKHLAAGLTAEALERLTVRAYDGILRRLDPLAPSFRDITGA